MDELEKKLQEEMEALEELWNNKFQDDLDYVKEIFGQEEGDGK